MGKKEKSSKLFKVATGLNIVKTVIYIVLVGIIAFVLYNKFSKDRVTYNSSSNLVSTEEIEKFNLAKFSWNGIAKYYNEENTDEVDTFIKYDADIIATMNMEGFNDRIKYDEKNKKIHITLPKIELKPTVIIKNDGTSFAYIPKKTSIEMKEVIKTCEEDALEKVNERVQLQEIAKENAKSTIEGLLLPVIEGQNYTIVWEEGE